MIPIKGYATFHPLKHCIVGRAHDPKKVSESLQEVMYNTEEDIGNLIKILESMDVVCYRPDIENDSENIIKMHIQDLIFSC